MGTWILAGMLLVVALLLLVGARRKTARRAVVSRARGRARRYRPPLVSANLHGQAGSRSDVKPDIWREEQEAAARDEHVA